MMLSDGSGLVFTVREFLSPLGRYVLAPYQWSEIHLILFFIFYFILVDNSFHISN